MWHTAMARIGRASTKKKNNNNNCPGPGVLKCHSSAVGLLALGQMSS